MVRRRLILKHNRALGDTILLSALVRDIHLSYPGYFEICVDANFSPVWENSPLTRLVRLCAPNKLPISFVQISYADGIKAAGRGVKLHMLSWFHRNFAAQTGMELYPRLAKGDLYLTEAEKQLRPAPEPYQVLVAGCKDDITIKRWPTAYWQAVVDGLTAKGIRCVQVGAVGREHSQPKLTGVVDMVGKQSVREYFATVYNAAGVICPITSAMHLAACFDKPCVVIAGGREEPWYEGYTNEYSAFGDRCTPVVVPHRYLHTIGKLDCCQNKGCWKHRVVPLNDKNVFDGPSRRCYLPDTVGVDAVGRCMKMVTPDTVLEAVMSYPTETAKALLPDPMPGTEFRRRIAQPLEDMPKPIYALPEVRIPEPIDDPRVGGKFTVFVLCYGPHPDLARRCIGSILKTLPADRLDLRVATADACQETLDYLFGELTHVGKLSVYQDANIGKYKIMRQLFRDPQNPITTQYVVWFDDDAFVTDPKMWERLSASINVNHDRGGRMYGAIWQHDLQPFFKNGYDPRRWFQQAAWWRDRDLHVRGTDQSAPNGTCIPFISGWFWALHMSLIQAADIPDARLIHNGDICIGEQVRQAGGKLALFNPKKVMVSCPSKEAGGRRGTINKPFPWTGE